LYGVLAIPDNGDVRLPIAAGTPSSAMPIGANMAVRAAARSPASEGCEPTSGNSTAPSGPAKTTSFFFRLLHAGCRGVYEPSALVHHLVPSNRLDRRYFRQWLHQNGRDVARLERAYPAATPFLLGVPR
jgi:hypothetical protein